MTVDGQAQGPVTPGLLSLPDDVKFLGLIPEARAGRVFLYVGAGISGGADLPTGKDLAQRIHGLLQHAGYNLAGVDAGDLLAVADAAVPLGQLRDIQELAAAAAPFTTASPTNAHRAIALLMLEGATKVLSTNWDTCIERAAPAGERISAIVTDADRLSVRSMGLHKVHGCADQPQTVLLTTAQLDHVPVWAETAIAAALSQSTVIFIGIGDVAPYIARRLTQLIGYFGAGTNVRVVSPNIIASWPTSKWAALQPALAEESKIAMSADVFCDSLLRAWVKDTFFRWTQVAADMNLGPVTSALATTLGVFKQHTGDRVLRWFRWTSPTVEPGTSVIQSNAAAQAVCALAVATHTAPIIEVPEAGPLKSEGMRVDLHLAGPLTPGPRAARSARNQVAVSRSRGLLKHGESVKVICAGHIGPLEPEDRASLAADILEQPRAGDLVTGAQAGPLELIDAEQILREAA